MAPMGHHETSSNSKAIGIDLGGTQIKAVLVSAAGAILRREIRETLDGGQESKKRWAEVIRTLIVELGSEYPVGLSAPGLAAANRRSIAFMPGRLQGLEGLDWGNFLGKSFVPVSNDAQASLFGEAWIGAARGLKNVVMITLGTGVGGAIIADGNLLRGHLGRAGHLGHVCLDMHGEPSIVGTPGSLEGFIGNHNIRERTAGRFATTHDLIAAFERGEPHAEKYWLASIRALACGITSFINVLDPEAILIGGGIARAGEALFGPLKRELDKMEWRPVGKQVTVHSAELGEWAGAIGAAREAMRETSQAR